MPIDHMTDGFAVRAGQTQLYTINDNRGRSFEFKRSTQPTGGWLAVDAIDDDRWVDPTGDTRSVVLGSVVTTDVLIARPIEPVNQDWAHLMHFHNEAGLAIVTARRAAWTSLAFALRAAAADLLQVEVRELDAGVRLDRHRRRRGPLPGGVPDRRHRERRRIRDPNRPPGHVPPTA